MMATALPGFDTPAVGFEQPFEMLAACHDRVRRSLTLLQRMIEHIQAKGHDAQSRAAVADVLRYFDLAAPHHLDEERHVFAVLAAAGDATLAATTAGLRVRPCGRGRAATGAGVRAGLRGPSSDRRKNRVPGCAGAHG